MARAAVKSPYQPGRGVSPPLLAGRESLLAEADERLDFLADGGMPSQDLLFHGPRGNGKTSLLIAIERRAGGRGLGVGELPVRALSSEEQLVRHLQERAGVLGDRVTGLHVATVGISATLAATLAAPSREIGRLFAAWIGAAGGPQVILIDEVHAPSPKGARPFCDAVQAARNGRRPFLLVAAGTPDAPRRLRETATHNERGFRQIPVGRLRRPETIRALAEPARISGLPMEEDAAALLADASQDYPFFIQLLGNAAWQTAADSGASGIGADAARRGIAASRRTIEGFYSGRYEEAWKRGIGPALTPLARLFAEHEGHLFQWDLLERLTAIAAPDSFPLDAPALLDNLRDLGVIWEADPPVWELGIPSFADFVLRRRPSAAARER